MRSALCMFGRLYVCMYVHFTFEFSFRLACVRYGLLMLRYGLVLSQDPMVGISSSNALPFSLHLPRSVVGALECDTPPCNDAIGAAAATVLSAEVPKGVDPTDVASAAHGAAAALFAHCLRLRIDQEATFVDLLTGSTVLASDRVDFLWGIYKSHILDTDAYRQGVAEERARQEQEDLNDGPMPRLTGLRWRMGHELGNRMMDPPERSAPTLTIEFVTADGKAVKLHVTQEQAQDLLSGFRTMTKEAERLQGKA